MKSTSPLSFCVALHMSIYSSSLFFLSSSRFSPCLHTKLFPPSFSPFSFCLVNLVASEAMRGGFGRNRADPTQPVVAINTYEDALYPPRPYRYYVVDSQLPFVTSLPRSASSPQAPPALVMPSVDSDAVCTPRPGIAHPPPSLRSFFECFVRPSSSSSPSPYREGGVETSDAPLGSLSEPLNVLHYPQLLPCWQNRTASVAPSQVADTKIKMAESPSATSPLAVPTPQEVSGEMTRVAKAAGLPAELYTVFTGAHIDYLSHGAADAATTPSAVFVVRKPERLRVCPVPRRAPPRPTRRGTKVTVASSEGPIEVVAAWQRAAGGGIGGVLSAQMTTSLSGHDSVAGKKRAREDLPLSELFSMDGEEEEDGEDEKARARQLAQSHAPSRTFNDDDDDPHGNDDEDDDEDDIISVPLVSGDDDDMGDLNDRDGSGDDGDFY